MESLTLEVDDEWLSVHDLQEGLQVVPLGLLGVVEYVQLHLFSWLEHALPWLHVEDFVVEDVLFEGLLGSWLARISPRLHFDL
jgi:hypothetical protein